MMLGAFVASPLMTTSACPTGSRSPLAIAVMARFGFVLEHRCLAPILGQPQFAVVMLTIGLGYVARGLDHDDPRLGTETHVLPVPYKRRVVQLGDCRARRRAARGHRRPPLLLCAAALRASSATRRVGIAHAGRLAEPARRLLHGHPGQCVSTADLGDLSGRGGRGRRHAAGADHLRCTSTWASSASRRFRPRCSAASASMPGALVGGLIIGIVELSPASTCPRASRTSPPTWWCWSCCGQAARAVRRDAPQEGLRRRCASSSRPTTTRTSGSSKQAGQRFWYGAARSSRCSLAPLAAAATTTSSQLTFVLIYGIVGARADAAGRLHRPAVARPRRVPRRRRLHRRPCFPATGVPFPVASVALRRACRHGRRASSGCRRCA